MAMMGPAAESPDAYIAALSGWQREQAAMMRAAAAGSAAASSALMRTNDSPSQPLLVPPS